MSAIAKFLDRLRTRRSARRALNSYQTGESDRPLRVTPATKTSPPVIHGPFGDTTERVRLQAAINIRDSAEVRQRVMEMLTRQLGSEERALDYAKTAYPEAFE